MDSVPIMEVLNDRGSAQRAAAERFAANPDVTAILAMSDVMARGALDAVVESDVNILDIAALSVIVTEAGGRFTDLAGGPVGLDTTTVLASNGALHGPLLDVLAG